MVRTEKSAGQPFLKIYGLSMNADVIQINM
jgi:hypothetical protein